MIRARPVHFLQSDLLLGEPGLPNVWPDAPYVNRDALYSSCACLVSNNSQTHSTMKHVLVECNRQMIALT